MTTLSQIEEMLYLPLKALWDAKAGLGENTVKNYTAQLLTPIDALPALGLKIAVILGATNATAFAVDAAVKADHKKFVLVGNKKIGKEHPDFTGYIKPRLSGIGLSFAENQQQTETDYAYFLLTQHYGIPSQAITRFGHDTSTNTGANMKVLRKEGYQQKSAIEFYALAGTGLRALMTARKELGDKPVIAVHNAYPHAVTNDNWSDHPVARAHMSAEFTKTSGSNPLYVRRGFCSLVDMKQELHRCLGLPAKTISAPSPFLF